MIRLDNMAELKPTTIAVAATEPIFGSGFTEAEKRFCISELELLLGAKKAKDLLDEARAFHERIGNTKIFNGGHHVTS